ncbi:MAG: hypothetical protein HZB55_00850 [Deltaproteobacteria bacterium]|nr:hypothetical protein [Deltaproteobacteria bacterium]
MEMIARLSGSVDPLVGTSVACPFVSAEADSCTASIWPMELASLDRGDRCRDERFDGCPLFVAKVIRLR